jgi:hypothetical protein
MTKSKMLLCLAVAVCAASAARADVTYLPKEGEMEVIRLTVTPAREPVPALKYRLLARDIDLKPGNSAPYYYRAQLNLRTTMKNIRDKFDEEKVLVLWYGTDEDATPIAKLPVDKVREASRMFDPIYDQNLKPAFDLRDCDWQLNLEDMRGPDIVFLHLDEFQNCREISRMMMLRTRLAVAERRYDDAVELMRQNYRLGTDVAKLPFLVCGLIGIAIDRMTNTTAVELIANPDSPNLYWALTEMPEPLIDLRPATRFEINFGPRMFPFIHNSETTDHSPQEWNRLLTQSFRDLQKAGGAGLMFGAASTEGGDVGAGLAATVVGLLGYSHAKHVLVAQGMDRDRVEKMAVGQVIAIYTERTYRRFADDSEKVSLVPYSQMDKAADALDKRLSAASPTGSSEEREVIPIVSLLLPAMQAARKAQVRLDRDVAALRVIEAIRMYAASHDGRLPARLEDINEVPVPVNPATGKPFAYRLQGATAILELPPSDKVSGGDIRYEIQIANKK